MKRKNIKNDKVLRAITIGLATMIAATSAPLNVYAEEAATADGAGGENAGGGSGDTTSQQPASSVETEPEESVPEAVVTEEEVKVDVVEVESVTDAIDQAADVYEQHAESVDNKALKADDAAIKAEVDKANDILKNSESLNNADLNNALVQTAVAEANIEEVKKALVGVYLEHSDKDDAGKDRLQYDVPRDENGDLLIDEDNCPEVGKGSAVDQISGQYSEDSDPDDGVNLKTRSTQGTYQDGMKQITEAIKQREKGNSDKEKEALEKAGEYLAACETMLDDTSKALADATAQYKAAKEAADAAQASYDKVQGLIETAISDTNAAEAQLNAAKDRAEKLTSIADQYYGLMIKYFATSVGTAKYDENGKLDVEASAEAAASVTGKDKQIVEGDGLGNDTYAIGRELLEQLIMYKLESEGAQEITFGATGVDGDGKTDKIKSGEEKKVSIEKDSNGNDKVALTDAGSHTQYREDGDNGRKNHFKVTYTDKEGNAQTKYYNLVYKGTKYEGSDVDLTKGVCYVAEVVYDKEAKKWNYAPYSEESDFLSDYNLTKGYRDAAAAVEKSKAEVVRLRNELSALSDKVATNSSVIDELKGELDKAQEAYDNSAKSLKDFQDLYRYMTEGVQPSDLIEDDIIPEEDDIPGGDDETTGGGDETTDGDDDTTGGDEDPGAGGGVVFDPSTGTFSAPAYGFGSTILPGFTGGPATGVLGVRTGGGTEADEGGVADSRTDVAPRADFGTVNKVLGSRQNKDNSQLVKKIKDNEIPLADIPNMDDEVKMNWWWLLIIFLLGATGKKMYDEYKKKKEAEEAAKINK